MYLTEIAPLKLRGAVGVLCQLGITCGVLMGQIAGLDNVLGTIESWNVMLACFVPLCVAALFLNIILPESPKYLYIIKGQHGKALKGACNDLTLTRSPSNIRITQKFRRPSRAQTFAQHGHNAFAKRDCQSAKGTTKQDDHRDLEY